MFVLTGAASAEIIVKKSRFLSEAFPVSSAEEASAIVKRQKAKYADASHVVHAFSVGLSAETLGAGDAGEPSGTAGEPTLNVLRHFPLTNALIATTRWFGGTLLGTGGLSRAYSDSAAAVLAAAKSQGLICEYVEKRIVSLECDYADLQKVKKILSSVNFDAKSETFAEKIILEYEIAKSDVEKIQAQIQNATAGRVKVVPAPHSLAAH